MGVGRVPAHLAIRRLHLQPGRAGRDDHGRDLTRPGERGDGDHGRDRRAGVGDEGFLAVDDPLSSGGVGGRSGTCSPGIAAGVGLRQPERPERTAGTEVGQPPLLLLRAPELEDRIGPEADARFQGDGDRLVDSRQFLDGDTHRGEIAPTPSNRFGKRDPEQPELTHLANGVDGELVSAIPLRGVRLDLRVGELTNQRAQRVVLVGELWVH